MKGRIEEPGRDRWERADWWGVVLSATDPYALARFYSRLLGWSIHAAASTFVTLVPPDGVAYLGFRHDPDVERPTYPYEAGTQHVRTFLNFETVDLEAALTDVTEHGGSRTGIIDATGSHLVADPEGNIFWLYQQRRS